MSEPYTDDIPDLRVGLLAIRQEFLNLSELKHCLGVRSKLLKKGHKVADYAQILVQERYLTPENLEYLHMIAGAEPDAPAVSLEDIEREFRESVAELKKDSHFAHYKVLGELGRGGMGVVLSALDTETEDEVALKILIGLDRATVRDIERFKKEATVMRPLIHPGIVKILDVGRWKGLDYIAMEYIRGRSLKEIIEAKPKLNPVRALTMIRSAAEAVGFIHNHGIIHRDIKPENIMVRDADGSAVLMDFGLAGWDKIEILSGRGSIGTPMYQPPEQADVGGPFGKISEASDVYGLGATLYFLVTGRHPFTGRSVKEVREKIKRVAPAPPSAHRKDIPEVIEALVLRCMKKRQTERFNTPKALIEHIDKVLDMLGARQKAKRGASKKANLTRKSNKTQRVGANRAPTKKGSKKTGKLSRSSGGKSLRRGSESQRRISHTELPRGTGSYSRKSAWYENPTVLVLGTIAMLLFLFIVGTVLMR